MFQFFLSLFSSSASFKSQRGSRVTSCGKKTGPFLYIPDGSGGTVHGEVRTKLVIAQLSGEDLGGRRVILSGFNAIYATYADNTKCPSLGGIMSIRNGKGTMVCYSNCEMNTANNGGLILDPGMGLTPDGYKGPFSDFSGTSKTLVIAFPETSKFEQIQTIIINDIELKRC